MDKKCSKCGEIKPIDLFQTDNTKPDKHRPECKSCSNKPRSFYEKVDKKVCQRCKVEKKIEDFAENKLSKDMHLSVCKECVNKGLQEFYDIKEKKCTCCNQIKKIDQFYVDLKLKNGRTPRCKECTDAIHGEYNKQVVESNTDEKLATVSGDEPRKCIKCNKIKPTREFDVRKYSVDGYDRYCKVCKSKYGILENENLTPEEIIEQFYANESVMRKKRLEMKYNVFAHYSDGTPKCANPYHIHSEEVAHLNLLVLDHINGDGYLERYDKNGKPNGHGGNTLYRKLIKEGFPEGYQVLCHNCNAWKKEINKEYGAKYKQRRAKLNAD